MRSASQNSWVVKSAFFVLGTVFLATMFLSLFYMSSGMDMASGMSGCPLMLDQSAVCQMDIHDHVAAWKSLFLSIVPSILVVVALGSLAVAFSRAPNLLQRPRLTFSLSYKEAAARPLTFSYRALQELFANGILHPKLYNARLS